MEVFLCEGGKISGLTEVPWLDYCDTIPYFLLFLIGKYDKLVLFSKDSFGFFDINFSLMSMYFPNVIISSLIINITL